MKARRFGQGWRSIIITDDHLSVFVGPMRVKKVLWHDVLAVRRIRQNAAEVETRDGVLRLSWPGPDFGPCLELISEQTARTAERTGTMGVEPHDIAAWLGPRSRRIRFAEPTTASKLVNGAAAVGALFIFRSGQFWLAYAVAICGMFVSMRLLCVVTVQLTDEALVISVGRDTVRIAWNDISAVEATRFVLAITTTKGATLRLPRQRQLEELVSLLEQLMDARNHRFDARQVALPDTALSRLDGAEAEPARGLSRSVD